MNIGKIIYGYCNGYFGRDDYDNKVIVYETSNSIACIHYQKDYDDHTRSHLTCANFDDEKDKDEHIKKWGEKDA